MIPEKTRQIFLKTLSKLASEKSIEEISVQDIIRESGFSRQTFYRYYSDKYDLMNQVYSTEYERLLTNVSEDKWYTAATKLMESIFNDRAFYNHAFEVEGHGSMYEYLVEYNYKIYSRSVKKRLGRSLNEVEKFRLRLYVHGSISMLKELVRNDESMTALQSNELYYASMPDFLQDLWDSTTPLFNEK
jgi:AcrR family transcriptional regulator